MLSVPFIDPSGKFVRNVPKWMVPMPSTKYIQKINDILPWSVPGQKFCYWVRHHVPRWCQPGHPAPEIFLPHPDVWNPDKAGLSGIIIRSLFLSIPFALAEDQCKLPQNACQLSVDFQWKSGQGLLMVSHLLWSWYRMVNLHCVVAPEQVTNWWISMDVN